MCKDYQYIKEGMHMVSSTISKKHRDYISGMDDYIKNLKKLPAEKAADKSKKSLIRSGVLTRRGNKRVIVK